MIVATSGMFFAAAFLLVMSGHQAWDWIASRFVSAEVTQARLLSLDEQKISFWLRAWGIALVTTLILGLVLGMLPIALGLVAVLLFSPRWLLAFSIRRRSQLLRDQMVGCSRALANSARAGQSLPQALEAVSAESPLPIRAELQRIVGEYQMGRPLVEALADARQRLRLDSFSLFASSIIVSLERGGSVTEALERICGSLQENQRIERKLAAETASGWRVVLILTAFPFLFLAGFAWLHPSGTKLMFETLLGQALLLTILGLVVASLWWSRKILTIEM